MNVYIFKDLPLFILKSVTEWWYDLFNKVNANSGPRPVIQVVGQCGKYKPKLRKKGRYMQNSGPGLVIKL